MSGSLPKVETSLKSLFRGRTLVFVVDVGDAKGFAELDAGDNAKFVGLDSEEFRIEEAKGREISDKLSAIGVDTKMCFSSSKKLSEMVVMSERFIGC